MATGLIDSPASNWDRLFDNPHDVCECESGIRVLEVAPHQIMTVLYLHLDSTNIRKAAFERCRKFTKADLQQCFNYALGQLRNVRMARRLPHGFSSVNERDAAKTGQGERQSSRLEDEELAGVKTRESVKGAGSDLSNGEGQPEERGTQPTQERERRSIEEQKWIDIAIEMLSMPLSALEISKEGSLSTTLKSGCNILQDVCRLDCSEIVEKVLEEIKKDMGLDSDDGPFRVVVRSVTPFESKTALHFAILNLDSESVRVLLKYDDSQKLLSHPVSRQNPIHWLVDALAQRGPADTSPDDSLIRAEAILHCLSEERGFALLTQGQHDGKTPYQLAQSIAEVTGAVNNSRMSKFQEAIKRTTYSGALRYGDSWNECSTTDIERSLYGKQGCPEKIFSLELLFEEGMDKFWHWLEAFKPSPHIRLDPWLLVLRLGRLDRTAPAKTPDNSTARPSIDAMLAQLIKTLSKDFKVEKIWKIQIVDDIINPTSDAIISAFASHFQVEQLDWRKENLDIDALLSNDLAVGQLEKLWLYSGTIGSLMYWSSEDGIVQFPKLKKAIIVVFSDDTSSRASFSAKKARIETRFQRSARDSGRFIDLTVEEGGWWGLEYLFHLAIYRREKTTSERFFKIFESTSSQLEHIAEALLQHETSAITGEEKGIDIQLKQHGFDRDERGIYDDDRGFTSGWSSFLAPCIKAEDLGIKVAIIDTGVDAWHPALAGNIRGGASFVDSGPWYKPANPHGTMMAALMRKINPLLRLYVYRVASLRNDLSLEAAAKAIRHAADSGVDIINCSWTAERNDTQLQHAIEYATSHGESKHPALVFCATSDEPHHYRSIWPADYTSHVISVSAASASGRNRVETRMRFDLLILGEDMPVFDLSEEGGKPTTVTGSSAATAIASGLASLVLVYCKLLGKEDNDWHEFKRKDKMLEIFKLMSHLTDNKEQYVDPLLIFKDRFRDGWPMDEDRRIFRDSFWRGNRIVPR